MMPRMNGEEFVQELSRRGRRAEFPIIILSADPRASAFPSLSIWMIC